MDALEVVYQHCRLALNSVHWSRLLVELLVGERNLNWIGSWQVKWSPRAMNTEPTNISILVIMIHIHSSHCMTENTQYARPLSSSC